jgi:hypothetical protein
VFAVSRAQGVSFEGGFSFGPSLDRKAEPASAKQRYAKREGRSSSRHGRDRPRRREDLMTRTTRVCVAAFLCFAALGCGPKRINQLLANPSRYTNQTITVRGTVGQSASLAGRGVYKLVDGDQSLWVVTTSGAPRQGAHVDVTGRLQDKYDLSAFSSVLNLPGSLQSGLVLVASSHRARD